MNKYLLVFIVVLTAVSDLLSSPLETIVQLDTETGSLEGTLLVPENAIGIPAALIIAGSGPIDELSSDAKEQIDHLLTFIATSPCKFMRNGKWYESSEAVEHIKKKYHYVLGKGWVVSPEDFVKYAATKSSMSGKSYKVKCGDSPEIDSADWLLDELKRYRGVDKIKKK